MVRTINMMLRALVQAKMTGRVIIGMTVRSGVIAKRRMRVKRAVRARRDLIVMRK